MKTSTLRQIIKEEIAQSSASELLSMLAHPDFKKQLSILNNDSVNNAYENLYATLMGIERNESLNENTSRTIIINNTEEWEDLANNLEGYKYSGSLKPVSANRGLIQLSNYAKYPYEVIIDDKNKMIQFGEHSLK
jgi:hypothetical protein